MRVRDIMTPAPTLVSPDDNLERAAQLMSKLDAGALPVGENDRLVGMITDRDIALRAAGQGRNPQTTLVRDAMSSDVKYCFEDEAVENVAENMGRIQVRRLPVLNRRKRLVGIVSLGDVSRASAATSGQALREVSAATGRHSQRADMGFALGPKIAAVASVAGLAALLMYLFDGTNGPRRRAMLRDQLVKQTQNLRRGASELAARTRSKVAEETGQSSSTTH